MHRSNLLTIDGAVVVSIPEPLLVSLGLQADSAVDLTVENGRLVIQRHARPRYTLEELLAQCDAAASLTDEDREWLSQPAVGREAI